MQEHRFRPIAGKVEISSDFRLIAATNRDLDQLVLDGKFREDLLFRLRAFVIELPPLREWKEDIELLARFHMEKLCRRFEIPVKKLSDDYIKVLTEYAWPGNVRELVNMIDCSITMARNLDTLYPSHLPNEVRVQVARASFSEKVDTVNRVDGIDRENIPTMKEIREQATHQAEKQYLDEIIKITEGNVKEMCRISMLSRSQMYHLL